MKYRAIKDENNRTWYPTGTNQKDWEDYIKENWE